MEDTDHNRVVEVMISAERWDRQDLRNILAAYSEQEIELRIWRAQEFVRRKHGIVFGVVSGHPGLYQRIRDDERLAQHCGRQYRAGLRKIQRAAEKRELASKMTPDKERSERHQRAAERLKERLLWKMKKKDDK